RPEHDWDNRCRLLCREHCASHRDNNIDFEPDELSCDLSEAFWASLRPANLDPDSATIDPTEFAQPLCERGDLLALDRSRARPQEADGRQLRLLRARRERPRSRRAAQQPDELAPFHCPVPPVPWDRKDSTPRYGETAAVRDFNAADDRCGSHSVIRRCRAQCPVCPQADTAGRFMSTRLRLVAYRLQWQTRSLVEVESAFDHGEVATAPNCTTKVVLDAEGVACGHGDTDVIALPDLLPVPEARQRWIAFIGGVRYRCTKHRQRSDTG